MLKDWSRCESNEKVVTKPWGREIWLELNEHYCFKIIQVNAGQRLSLQYHLEKHETSYVVSGEAELWLENEHTKSVEKYHIRQGDVFTVRPGLIHRLVATTNLVVHEVSTPHVHDIVRIEDDNGRPGGYIKIEHVV